MAVEGYEPIVISPCVDNAQMDTNFASLAALIREMVNGTSDVVCTPIDASNSGTFNTGETTTEMFPATGISTLETESDTCLFLGSIQVIRGSLAEDSIARVRYTIRCGNTIVQQGLAYSGGAISSLIAFVECSRGEAVTITTSLENQASETAETYRMEYEFRVCGGRACISNRDIIRSGASVPCFPTGDCCLGMDALALMAQNLNALTSAFDYGGKQITLQRVTALDDESVPVQLNFASDATYIVFGSIEVCFENTVTDPTIVRVEPVIGCTEGENAACLVGTAEPDGYSLRRLRVGCQRFPVLTCGNCSAGQDLYVGQNPNFECNADVDPDPNTIGYSVKGDYCIWIFEDIVNELETVSYPPQCITTDYLQSLETSASNIEQAVCDRSQVNVTTRDLDIRIEDGDSGDQVPFVIQEAIPFVPPPDDPTATAPVKKWFVSGNVQICHAPLTIGLGSEEETIWARLSWTYTCGGVPVTDLNGDVITGNQDWILESSTSDNLCSPIVQMVGNVECPTDEPLELLVNVNVFQPGQIYFDGPWTTTGEIKAICF